MLGLARDRWGVYWSGGHPSGTFFYLGASPLLAIFTTQKQNNTMPQDPTQQNTLLQHIRALIARDELPQALQQLQQFFAHAPQLDEVIHQSGRFANIRQQIRLGTVSHAEANLTRNQISYALLELLHEIEAQARETPALQQEMKAAIAIVDSKNVVVNSHIQTGGDVHIGDKHVTQHAEKIYNIERIDKADFS